MSYAKLLDAIILKQKAKKSKPQRRMEQSVFKMIVEMAYEMKYANRHCEAERTNRFKGIPPNWNALIEDGELPFDTETKKYNQIRLGDIVIVPHFPRGYYKWVMTRIAKVIRINKKSISLADCDQDGQLIEYNPDEDCDFQTKEHRKDYNKLFPRLPTNHPIIVGTKHLRYEGWDS
jgi:hypothetical protein